MTEVFERLCPYCMAIGMSYEEYWYGECELVKYYKEACSYLRRQKNQELWIQGMYFAMAVASVLDKKSKYPTEPLDIFPKTEEEKRIEQEKNRQKLIDYFTSFKQRWERNGND